MNWRLSHRADKAALPLADRHYNRQKQWTPQFVPPGRCLVFLTSGKDALWVSSWPFKEKAFPIPKPPANYFQQLTLALA